MLEFLEKPGVVIVLLVALVVFGSKRLPDSARSLGRSMRILKAEAKGLKDDDGVATPSPDAQAVLPLPVAAPQPVAPVQQVAPPAPVAAPTPVVTSSAEQPDQRTA